MIQIDKNRILELMRVLDISREEAIEVIQDDDDIDHNKPKDFDLSPEQQKVVATANRKVAHKRTTSGTPKERQPNERKRTIINALYEFLTNSDIELSELKIEKPEKLITFAYGEKTYSLDLIEHRGKKK